LHRLGPIDTGDPARPGIVHRLDKPTSGLLVVARNAETHRALALQFKERTVRKEYIALVHGVPRPARGTIDRPLGRDPVDRKKISVRARRSRPAITHYEVVETFGDASLLDIEIETGRTHQIRAHLATIAHPVVGDETYAGTGRRKPITPGRLFLHARRLKFRHPRTGEILTFESPLPDSLRLFLENLKNRGRPT
jgi:23S rRNA pseudouridine1911/1915/1917 synthase